MLGREPSREELAEATRLPLAHVRQRLAALRRRPCSIRSAWTAIEASSPTSLPIRLPLTSPRRQSGRFRQTVQHRLERLPERERLIVERRFGLQGERRTLETVGRELGLTRERVRQLQVQALKQLETELADLARMQTAAARAAHAREAERIPA